jgi:hypothetical protein
MPIPAGTNCLTQAEDKLVTLLAQSTKVQAWLGAANETEARLRIHLDATSGPVREEYDTIDEGTEWSAIFPAIVVHVPEEGLAFDAEATSAGLYDYAVSGTLIADFYHVTPTEDITTAERQFKNYIGDILEELASMIGAAIDRLSANRFSLTALGRLSEDREKIQGRTQVATVQFEWGLTTG